MYVSTQQSGKVTRATGAFVSAAVLSVVAYAASQDMFKYEQAPKPEAMTVTLIEPPPEVIVAPPEPEIEPPPEVELEPPPALEAPPIEIPPPDPVITAPPAPPEPAVETTAPVQMAGTDRVPPRLRSSDKPAYPAASIRAQEEGRTHLEVCVNERGRVQSVNIAGSSGHPRLDQAAAKWVRSARFTPGSIGGVARPMCGHAVIYEWNLEDA